MAPAAIPHAWRCYQDWLLATFVRLTTLPYCGTLATLYGRVRKNWANLQAEEPCFLYVLLRYF